MNNINLLTNFGQSINNKISSETTEKKLPTSNEEIQNSNLEKNISSNEIYANNPTYNVGTKDIWKYHSQTYNDSIKAGFDIIHSKWAIKKSPELINELAKLNNIEKKDKPNKTLLALADKLLTENNTIIPEDISRETVKKVLVSGWGLEMYKMNPQLFEYYPKEKLKNIAQNLSDGLNKDIKELTPEKILQLKNLPDGDKEALKKELDIYDL